MILSTTTCVLDKKFGQEKAIEIIARAGFDAVDLSLCDMRDDKNIFNGEDYIDVAKSQVNVAKRYGIRFNQAHAYFPSSFNDEEKTRLAFKKIIRGIEIASVVGAKIIVVHPMQHLYYPEGKNPEILKEMNFKFYKSLIPYCEKYGISIAIENMWQRSKVNNVIIDSTCSCGPEFCEYVDMIGSEWMTACLDLGHCGLVGLLPQNMIRELGHDRLGALHVHDNNGRDDNHVEPMAPFVSTIDWEEVCKALAEINYKGDFTFEAEQTFKNANEYTVDAFTKSLHDIGRYLLSRIEYYKMLNEENKKYRNVQSGS